MALIRLNLYLQTGRWFTCLLCQSRFSVWKTLRAHSVRKHGLELSTKPRRSNVEKKFICLKCDKGFVWNTGLDRHKREAHD